MVVAHGCRFQSVVGLGVGDVFDDAVAAVLDATLSCPLALMTPPLNDALIGGPEKCRDVDWLTWRQQRNGRLLWRGERIITHE